MNVIWWFDSIWLWCNQHWIICRRKRRGKENLEKKKRQWNGSDVASLVFLILHKRTHVWSMKNRCVYEQEGSDGGRVEGQEKRVEEKRGEKKEKGKSGFGKSPFCFCLTVFASSLFPLALNHHATTHAHTHHTIQHDALVHSITCKQDHVLVLLRTPGPFQQNCDDVILFFAIRGFLLPNSFFYDQPTFFCNLQFEEKSLFCN